MLMILLTTIMCHAETSEIGFNEVIKVVKSCEKKVGILKWKFESQMRVAPSSVTIGVPRDDTLPSSLKRISEVLFDPYSKRYKIHLTGEEIGVLPDKTSILYNHETVIAYNGSAYSAWKKNTPKNKDRNRIYDGYEGEIINDLSDGRLVKFFITDGGFAMSGFRTGVPCIFQPLLIEAEAKLFSEYISDWQKENRIIGLYRQNDGTIIIYAKIYDDPISHYITKVVYSPEKNGIITDYSILLSYSKESGDGKLYAQFVTKCKQNDKGIWVPSEISMSLPFFGPNGVNNEFIYRDFEIISRVPASEFQITFPDGTKIEDYVSKKSYKVGSIVDEDKKIDDFIQRHGLTGDVPVKSPSYGQFIRYILITIGGLMIIISLFFKIRKWWLKS
jgi:hypothetical protein